MTVAATYIGDDARATAFTERTGIPSYRWSVADHEACRAGVQQVRDALGPIDILINNAGITRDATLAKMSNDHWRAVIETNLGGCFNMSQAVLGGMRERGWGRIVNISSMNGQCGQFGQTNYAAAKAGILGFTKALALETARHGITVNAIAPGYTDTAMVRAMPEALLAHAKTLIPVGRFAAPEEVAHCVLFLLGDQAAFITGSTMSVNGGQYLS